MSERTFRAVVASVLVGALVLAAVIAVTLLPRPVEPAPSPSVTASPAATPIPSVAPVSTPGPALAAPDVVTVGQIPRGSSSGRTLVLRFLEAGVDAIPDAPGSFRLALTDHAGDAATVAFLGTPSVVAPGSLGATAILVAPNVLMVSIEASDTFNVELMTITGLGIRALPDAATGPVSARLEGFAGSLVTGVTADSTFSPGSIIAPR